MGAGAPLIGRQLGEFTVLDRLGEGGFAVVYRAEQKSLGREVVLKVLRTGRRVTDDIVARFLREARLASRLDHPFAAHVYAFGAEPDGVLWLAMELVRGTPLDRVLEEQGPMPLARFVPLLERLCEVVAAAHEQGIVHRDIKPGNVMVVSRGGRLHPKLLDFGIAKLAAAPDLDAATELAPAPGDGSITMLGASIGSPLYMAPEQWSAPTEVDGRADVYGLGVLAFEALTGVRAFAGETMHEIARAHATRPPPRVPANLPAALDEVFARALAKDPAERYPTATELAAALRAGAGLDPDADALPPLDGALRDLVLARAPQPLAEGLGALEAARNPHQARAALFDLVRDAAGWLGVLALAGRARVGGGRVDGAHELLRKDHLDEGDWLRVARALVAPLADRPEVHPVPELIDVVAAAGAPLDALIALRAGDEQAPRADAARARDTVLGGLPHVTALLSVMARVFDYDLVVGHEQWSGVRRSPRLTVRGAATPDDHPCLRDRDGAVALDLWPLCQVAAPAPGLAPELFVACGRAAGGARLRAAPAGFERVDAAAWDALRAAIAGPAPIEGPGDAAERAPYRGLASFTADDADLYVGREREVEAFGNRLRVTPLLVLVGPSGAGKSSFVAAGVVPQLHGWRAVVARPGHAPLAALGARLERELGAAGLAAELETDPHALGRHLRAAGPVLLVIDQLEELFTLGAGAAERQRFAAALVDAARAADDPVRIVLCLRDDFLLRAHELAPLRELLAPSLQLLGTPAPEELVRILVEPARRAGYEFDDDTLPAEMAAQVSGLPGALPLLSFTASRLWERRDRQARVLTRVACEALGGVAGALAQHAEATLAALPPDARAQVREAFRHLVTAEGTRAVLTRRELTQILGGDSVIEQLVGARLLQASEGEGGEEQIEIVHEALIGAWPRLVGWRREDADGARLRDQLRAAARQWHERGRPRGLLWRDDALVEYQRWRARFPGALTGVEAQFGAASLAEAARGRRLRRGLLGLAAAVLVVGSAVIWTQSLSTDRERRRAEKALDLAQEHASTSHARMIELYVEQGRLALLDDDPLRAAAYVAEAFRQGGDGATLRFLSARVRDALSPPPVRLEHGERVGWVAWSPDGARLVTASVDGVVTLWRADGATRVALDGRTGEQGIAVFSPDGGTIATAGGDGVVRLFDGATGAARGALDAGAATVHDVRWSPDGARLLTCADDMARIWDVAGARVARELPPPPDAPGRMRQCRWSPDGARVAASQGQGDHHQVLVWNAATGAREHVLDQPRAISLAFSPDGGRLVTGGGETARLWDLRTGAMLAELIGHAGEITDVAFSPDGARIATAGHDATARLWDGATGRLLRTLRGHRDAVVSVDFAPGGDRLLTTSNDGTARVWDAATGAPLRALHGHTGLVPRGAFAPDGLHVATAGWDRTALVWTAQPGWRASLTSDVPLDQATFTPDGAVLAVDRTGALRWYPAGDGALAPTRTLALAGADDAVWSADGRFVSVITGGKADVRSLPDGAVVASLGEGVQRVALRRDGAQAAAILKAGGVALWDVGAAAPRATIAPVPGLIDTRVSDDGTAIVGYHLKELTVWDGATGAPRYTLAGHEGHVYDLWLCHGGPFAASVGNDRTARVWNTSTGTAVATLEGHTSVTLEVDFSPDCARVVTASADGTVKVWEVATGRILDSIDVLPDGVNTAHVSFDGARLVTVDTGGHGAIWSLDEDTRSADEIVAWTRCHVPFLASEGRIAPAEIDPTCR